ncbi:hypothetical protein HBB16_10980 [Pseudonocardia sp. MCCB 268]|nr:hypothetical protein [Pseudonocardia cytotoxica]
MSGCSGCCVLSRAVARTLAQLSSRRCGRAPPTSPSLAARTGTTRRCAGCSRPAWAAAGDRGRRRPTSSPGWAPAPHRGPAAGQPGSCSGGDATRRAWGELGGACEPVPRRSRR